MTRAKMIFSLAFLATVHLAVAADPGAASAFRLFQVAEMPAPVYYFAPHRIEDGSRCETAAILIHGWGGGCNLTGDVEPFAAALAKAVGPSNTAPYVISPLFPRRRILQKNGKDDGRAVWNDSWGRDLSKRGRPDDDWRGGGDAAGVKLSSFDVVDSILLALGDRARYPALKRVIVTGFSAGGQFVGRYVAVGKGFVREGVEVRYAAMAPSTELWLDEDVLWHYGIKGRPRYSAQMTREQMLNNLSCRRVWRACGTEDVLGKSLDVCPAAMRQGANRYVRFRSFEAYLKQFPAWAKQVTFHAIEGIGHESRVAHTEKVFMDYVFGGDVEMLPSYFDGKTPVVVETEAFRFVINPDATARSLVLKATGEECLAPEAGLPVFASVQKRPFNNETRLVQMAKRTMYPANRVRRDGDILRIGFETAPYEVEVRVREREGYAAFEIVRFISNTVQEKQYGGLEPWKLDVPPIEEFRLLQLPVVERKNFGDWLNVEWDDHAAVAVVGATPYMDVDHERRGRWRLMRVDALSGIGHGITNGVAAIAAGAGKDALLAQIAAMELDYDLPRGVESRRNPLLNASIYWVSDLSVYNVDNHIANMKKGGFRMALFYSSGMFLNERAYTHYGNYDLDPEKFPNGYDDLKAVLTKIRSAGVVPGFHTLQTFIGFKSRYVTPEADPRLNVKRYFALERPLSASGATCDVYVAQNPIDAPMHPMCRILKFGTELMHYEGYTTTPPYRFTGVKRGWFGTTVKEHGRGYFGGILDVCECMATSCCIDQNTSLQDEIGDKIAKVFDCGMEFLYFDGSEDVNVPCNVNISLSQWKVARRCGKMPLFTEGCAKTHFGWHLQSGANAFDVFPPEVFKEKIIEYPYQAAKRLAKDFTRVDFGWWKVFPETQPDMWEYGTSKAAAFDCPATMQMNLHRVRANGRMDDLFETVRRWEDVRARKWLTPDQKEMLKDPKREFHLYLNETNGYELVEWKQIDVAGGKGTAVRAFLFERGGKRVVAYWHVRNRARLVFAQPIDGALVERALPSGNGRAVSMKPPEDCGVASLAAAGMKYFETSLPAETVRAAFASATIQPSTPNSQLSTFNSKLPSRHIPKRIMGRDYWPALYKYRDWIPRDWHPRMKSNDAYEVRFDNPEIFKLPAFRDAVPVYWARNNPPPVDGPSGTWRHFADNFTATERDREIIDSNPHPDRPFLFAATGNRRFWTWGANIDLDYAEYAAWRAKHPNALYEGSVLEWDNDLRLAYSRVKGLTNEVRRAKVEALIGKHPPKTRKEISWE